MTTQTILYEHPLNERIRTLLRLEHLFSQAHHFNTGPSSWDSRMLIASLFDILELFSRFDLKSEIIREVKRATTNLDALMENPSVDGQRLSTILKALQHISKNLHEVTGQLGEDLRNDPFLTSIRHRGQVPGGTSEIDLPGYHQWLSRAAELRHDQQQNWLNKLEPVQKAVELLLKLIRNSAEPQHAVAKEGKYQQQLEKSSPYQMIRLLLPEQFTSYPEISSIRHMFTIRFNPEQSRGERGKIVADDIPFELSLCLL